MVETLTSKDIINILNFINGYISKKDIQSGWDKQYKREIEFNFSNCIEWFNNVFWINKENKVENMFITKVLNYTYFLCLNNLNIEYFKTKKFLDYINKITLNNKALNEVVKECYQKIDKTAFCKVGQYTLYTMLDLILEIWQELELEWEMR